MLERCLAYEPLLRPGQFFSHETAARLFGAPLYETGTDIDISVWDPRTPPRGRGVVGHRVSNVQLASIGSLPVVAPADAWFQLSTRVRRDDLVAVGDYLVTGRRVPGGRSPALSSLDELADAVIRHAGKRGAGHSGWALPRVRVGVDSRPETLLRLLLVRARLPEPEIGVEVEVHGGLKLHPDLAYSRWRIAFDYEGDDHRVRRDVWLRDIERRELMEDAGWRVIRVTAADLFTHPEAFVERVRRVIAGRR